MRHNPKARGFAGSGSDLHTEISAPPNSAPKSRFLPAFALFSLFISIVILLAAQPMQAKPKPSTEPQNKPESTSENGKPGSKNGESSEQADSTDKSDASETDRSNKEKANLDEIDRVWIDSIHGREKEGSQKFANPGQSGSENAESSPESGSGENQAPGAAPRESPAASKMFATEEGPSFLSLLFRFVLFMGLMGAGFYGLVRFMKKKSGMISSGPGGPVRVVASVSLMPGKYLQIVDMAGQLMVLGVGDNGVTLLQNVDDGAVADRIRLWEENKPEPAESFLQGLQGILKTTDLRLWRSRKEANAPNFESIMRGRADQDDVPMEDLENLLNQQTRKLRALSGKSRPANET